MSCTEQWEITPQKRIQTLTCFPFAQPDRPAAEQGEPGGWWVHALWVVGGPVGGRDLLLRLRWIRLHRNHGSVLNESQAHVAAIATWFCSSCVLHCLMGSVWFGWGGGGGVTEPAVETFGSQGLHKWKKADESNGLG